MKKKFTFTAVALAMAAFSQNVAAQGTGTTYDFSDYMFDVPEVGQTSINGYFHHVSANGKYAVGYDDVYTPVSFIWNGDKPADLELIEPLDVAISACDVTNDGVVYGSYEYVEDGEEYSYGDGETYPSYMTTDGVWHKLPVPENFSNSYAKSYTLMNEARAVTPDGKFVAGNVYVVTGTKWSDVFNKDLEVVSLVPCLWEDGELKAVYDKFNISHFMVYDISDDGSIIVGMNEADCGGQNPAIIKNGELIEILDCDGEEGAETPLTFNGGICNSIDSEGNIYGYFQNEDTSVDYFVYTKDGNLEYVDGQYTCGGGGYKFSSGNVGLYSVIDCSDDGTVVVGGNVGDVGFGTGNVPALKVYDVANSIERLDDAESDVNVKFGGGNILITGKYDKAEVYSASGAVVAVGGQGHALGTSNIPAGTYIVKVSTTNGVKTFKVSK